MRAGDLLPSREGKSKAGCVHLWGGPPRYSSRHSCLKQVQGCLGKIRPNMTVKWRGGLLGKVAAQSMKVDQLKKTEGGGNQSPALPKRSPGAPFFRALPNQELKKGGGQLGCPWLPAPIIKEQMDTRANLRLLLLAPRINSCISDH